MQTDDMDDQTKPTEFAAVTGVSIPYASQLLSGKRSPSRSLAVSIYAKTGRKLGPLASLSNEDADTIARIEASPPDQQGIAA